MLFFDTATEADLRVTIKELARGQKNFLFTPTVTDGVWPADVALLV